jgi:hypothetical protein
MELTDNARKNNIMNELLGRKRPSFKRALVGHLLFPFYSIGISKILLKTFLRKISKFPLTI